MGSLRSADDSGEIPERIEEGHSIALDSGSPEVDQALAESPSLGLTGDLVPPLRFHPSQRAGSSDWTPLTKAAARAARGRR